MFYKNKKINFNYVRTQGNKKNSFSLHSFVFKCLIPTCICYLFVFKYFNYLYKKNTKLLLKKKKSLPHVKTIHSYLEISI